MSYSIWEGTMTACLHDAPIILGRRGHTQQGVYEVKIGVNRASSQGHCVDAVLMPSLVVTRSPYCMCRTHERSGWLGRSPQYSTVAILVFEVSFETF